MIRQDFGCSYDVVMSDHICCTCMRTKQKCIQTDYYYYRRNTCSIKPYRAYFFFTQIYIYIYLFLLYLFAQRIGWKERETPWLKRTQALTSHAGKHTERFKQAINIITVQVLVTWWLLRRYIVPKGITSNTWNEGGRDRESDYGETMRVRHDRERINEKTEPTPFIHHYSYHTRTWVILLFSPILT